MPTQRVTTPDSARGDQVLCYPLVNNDAARGLLALRRSELLSLGWMDQRALLLRGRRAVHGVCEVGRS